MEDIKQIQHSLFQQIKESLPVSHSFIHEIAEVLGISYDSSYRRVRGEKELTMEDLYRLATRFNISIDSLFNVKNQNVTFNCVPLDSENFKVKDWLRLVLQNIKDISSAGEREIIYAAKDVPVFHYFQIPEIAAIPDMIIPASMQLYRHIPISHQLWKTPAEQNYNPVAGNGIAPCGIWKRLPIPYLYNY